MGLMGPPGSDARVRRRSGFMKGRITNLLSWLGEAEAETCTVPLDFCIYCYISKPFPNTVYVTLRRVLSLRGAHEPTTNQMGEHWRVTIVNKLLKMVFAWHELIQSAWEDFLICISLSAKWQYFSLQLYRHSPRYIRLPWLKKGPFVLYFDEGETSKLCVYFWPIIWSISSGRPPHAEVLCWTTAVLVVLSLQLHPCLRERRLSNRGNCAIAQCRLWVDFQPPGGGVELPLTSPSNTISSVGHMLKDDSLLLEEWRPTTTECVTVSCASDGRCDTKWGGRLHVHFAE